jgi:hypothetical protein
LLPVLPLDEQRDEAQARALPVAGLQGEQQVQRAALLV